VHAGSADRLRPAGLALTPTVDDFAVTRAGVIMSPKAGEPHEAWGVLNPGGVRSADGAMHLFPRLIAEGNFSRIGHAVVHFDGETPVGVERRGVALEPHEHYEVNAGGGGVEDPRVVYVPELQRYVMTYTAFVPYEPRVAIAVSEDLERWQRLGVLRYEVHSDAEDLNTCGNKDAAFFPDVIRDPNGVPSLGILHRPTTRLHFHRNQSGMKLTGPPSGDESQENIWISYVPLDAVHSDIANLTSVRRHERVMAPERAWESRKVGTGAPPVRRPYGWVLAYHAVSARGDHPRYCMGIAVLDLERPSRVLYRTPSPVLEPETPYERSGLVGEVVFPSATSERLDGGLDLFYGAADHVVAAARIAVPDQLPATSAG
jgi:predicted GH43/DUF377 family glycosyl hydrolase